MKTFIKEFYFRLKYTKKIVRRVNYSSPRDSIYVIGNGPSLNKIDIAKLKNKDTISFNRAFIAYEEWGFYPTIYMVVDKIVLNNTKQDIAKLIKESPIKLFVLPLWSREFFPESSKIQYINVVDTKFIGSSFDNMGIITNVGATAVSVVHKLGYKNVIILGTDCNYEEKNIEGVMVKEKINNAGDKLIVYESNEDKDVNHFRKDYFGKGTKYSKPQQQNHFNGWVFVKKMNKLMNLNIILCSPGSKLISLFKECDYNQVVKKY